MSITNYFITGTKGIGKSTLLEQLIKQCALEQKVCGFRTLPYYEFPIRRGFYLHSLEPIAHNDRPISWQKDVMTCEPIPYTFDTLGVSILEESLKDDRPYILMDEVGVLEREAYDFQNTVIKVLDSNKMVIGVLKDKSHPFLKSIKNRPDTVVYVLKEDNFPDVLDKMVKVVTKDLSANNK